VTEDCNFERDHRTSSARTREGRVASALLQVDALLRTDRQPSDRPHRPTMKGARGRDGRADSFTLGNGFVARPALGEHVGRVDHAVSLQSPSTDDPRRSR